MMGLDKSPQNHKESQCLEWSLLTRQKSTTLKRSSGKKRCQEVRGVSLHFFGSFSTDLAKITCGISNVKWRSECTKAPFGDVSAVCQNPSYRKFRDRNRFQLEDSFKKLGKKLDLPSPNPIPHSQRIRWPPWQKWNSNFTKVLGFNPAPGWGLELIGLGVWGVKLELVGAVGWVGWISWAWVGGWGLGLRLFGWCASNKKPSVTNMDDEKW